MVNGERPHVVMMVGNDVSADSRVQKTAASLVAAGLRVTILDYAPKGGEPPATVAGCPVVRPKVTSELGSALSSGARLREVLWSLTHFGRYATAQRRRRATYRRKIRERGLASRIVSLKLAMRAAPAPDGVIGRVRRKIANRAYALLIRGLRWWLRVGRAVHRHRARSGSPAQPGADADAYAFASSGIELSASDLRRDWRTAVPDAAAIELAFKSVVDRLEPDAIHAHDFLMLPTGAEAARRARASGRRLPLVYDAHEYVRGLTTHHDERRRAVAAMEARFLPDADEVVTVSPALAERLQRDHDLVQRPTVVLNAPERAAVQLPEDGGVRGRLDLPGDARLMVYSGNVTPARGIHTLIDALPLLADDVHLVLVTAHTVPYLRGLLDQSEQEGTRHRLHLVPYVAPEEVPAYLSTADVGVHPMRRYPNGDIALPNKLFEYLHARLPIVVSDCPAQAAFVRDHGIGEVFRADDPADLAATVTRVLAEPDRFGSAYTDKLLATHSWEGQQPGLLDAYRRMGLLPTTPAAASPDLITPGGEGLVEGEAD